MGLKSQTILTISVLTFSLTVPGIGSGITSGTGTSSTAPEFVVIYSYENKHMIHFKNIIYNLNRTAVNNYVVVEFFPVARKCG
jgi:hypothetical protein